MILNTVDNSKQNFLLLKAFLVTKIDKIQIENQVDVSLIRDTSYVPMHL